MATVFSGAASPWIWSAGSRRDLHAALSRQVARRRRNQAPDRRLQLSGEGYILAGDYAPHQSNRMYRFVRTIVMKLSPLLFSFATCGFRCSSVNYFFGAALVERDRRGGPLSIAARKM